MLQPKIPPDQLRWTGSDQILTAETCCLMLKAFMMMSQRPDEGSPIYTGPKSGGNVPHYTAHPTQDTLQSDWSTAAANNTVTQHRTSIQIMGGECTSTRRLVQHIAALWTLLELLWEPETTSVILTLNQNQNLQKLLNQEPNQTTETGWRRSSRTKPLNCPRSTETTSGTRQLVEHYKKKHLETLEE